MSTQDYLDALGRERANVLQSYPDDAARKKRLAEIDAEIKRASGSPADDVDA